MIALSKMQKWFKQETENSVKKVRNEITKKMQNINSDMQELLHAAKEFEVTDTVDAESRSSQNIYEKITHMVEEFEFPKKVTYKSSEEFAKEFQKFLKRVMIIGKKFIPNLGGRKYKTRVYVLNRIMKQLQDDYKDFEKFLRKKTKLLREVDETSEYINTIIKKMEERSELKKKIQNTIKEAETIQEKIDKMDDKQSNLESQKIVVQLEELDQQINVECNKLTLETGSLDKPLRKLTSRAHDGIVKLPPGLKKLAEQLQDNPHKAFLSMEKNHPKLNSLIDILIDAIKTEKIKLKSSMKSRALELAEDIKNGSIIEMLNKVIEHEKKKEELDEKIDELGIRKEIEKFKKERQEYEKDKERKERTIRDLKSKLKKLNDEIAEIAAKTQKRVKELTDKEVKIDIKE